MEDLDSALDSVSSDTDYEPELPVAARPSKASRANSSSTRRDQSKRAHQKQATQGNPNPANPANPANHALLDDNPLFLALSSRDVAVADLALQWVQSYLQDQSHGSCNAITRLFNFILRCCGCTTVTQNHDMLNDDSAAATVTEVSLMFKKQKYHEYPFVSTNKEIKFFRRNVLEFFDQIVRVGHENGALYKRELDDSSLASPMMESLLAWLSALSSCDVRPLRYVSTTILLSMQSVLCELVATASVLLEKQRRLLGTTRARQTKKTARTLQRQIDTINNTIQTFAHQKDTLLEYISDIFLAMFVHRYRDVDVAMRLECARYLADWMSLYGEHFLQPEYLRYLGWLLSDPSDHVKEEVIKLLHKLYRSTTLRRDTMGSGFRQFTERFKNQLINMAWVEHLASIKTHLFGVYHELFKLGFLDPADCTEVCLFAFYLVEAGLVSGSSTKPQLDVCKLIVAVAQRRSLQEMERFGPFLSTHECLMFGDGPESLSVLKCLHFKVLAEILECSHAHYVQVKRPDVMEHESQVPCQFMVSRLFSTIYTFAAYQNSWEALLLFTLCDVSSADFQPTNASASPSPLIAEELKARLELVLPPLKYVALSMVSGAVLSILTTEKKAASNPDDFNYAVPKLITYFSRVEQFLSCDARVYAVFLALWTSVLVTIPGHITRLYSSVSSINDYNSVHERVLRYYADLDPGPAELSEAFDQYFRTLLRGFDGDHSGHAQVLRDEKILTAQVSTKIEDMVLSLVAEASDDLLGSEPIEDTNDSDENRMLPADQKVALNRLLNVKGPLAKLNQIAGFTSILRFVSEPVLGSSKILLEVLVVKLLSKADFRAWVQVWPTSLSVVVDHVADSWAAVFEFLLTTLSRKLEDLSFASNDSSGIDIALILGDYSDVVSHASTLSIQMFELVKELNETTTDSNARMRLLLEKLVQLKLRLATVFIDILAALRVFYAKFAANNSFKNFEVLFGNTSLKAFVSGPIDTALQVALMDVYFIEEARLAHKLGHALERGSGEDVNYEDFVFDGDEGESDGTWDSEKELCVYSVKLFSLQRTGALGDEATSRMELNCNALGPLYQQIVRQNVNQADPGLALERES